MCITANKHVHALKSWKEVPNGWNFTGIDMSAQTKNGGGISNCDLSKILWFGLCNAICTKKSAKKNTFFLDVRPR